MPANNSFPNDFVWGTATAAYQIEGAAKDDGRGTSIWDTFSHTPGKILDGSNGDVACDHYHRWQDDIKLMQEYGVKAYRFSMAWPRVLPNGTGAVNQRGLDFYERLVEGLLEADITPFITLYHWDLPQTIQDRGGWPNRSAADTFANYADIVVRRLGDRVTNWITLNEPWCSSMLGYLLGEHAPGARSIPQGLAAAHHLLLGHGLAVQAMRAAHSNLQIGITLNLTPAFPATDSQADEEATHRFDGFFNRWFLDPLHGRGYPEDMLTLYGSALPTIEANDLATIAIPTDFLGINYYTREFISHDASSEPLYLRPRSLDELRAAEVPTTEMGWEVYPDGLGLLLERINREYAPSTIYITENGSAFADQVEDGQVHDAQRTRYLQLHFEQALQAIAAGIPLRGYFVWSLMDNFEWAYGYTKRFGLTYVDYATQERIIKDSGRWYQQVVANNALMEP